MPGVDYAFKILLLLLPIVVMLAVSVANCINS